MKNYLRTFDRVILILLIISFTGSVCGTPVNVDPSKGLSLANDHVRFEFEPDGLGLMAMTDLKSKVNHIKAVDGKHLLWEVTFAVGKQIHTINNNYKNCSYATLEQLPDGTRRAVMVWNKMRWWIEDEVVSVQVVVELPEHDGVARWRIFVENNSDYWGLWSVQFPLVNGFPGSGEYDIARPSFARGGELLPSWKEKIRGIYPGGFWPMQFISFNKESNGVYLASMDPEARAKEFVVEPGKQVQIVHYPDNMGIKGSDYPDYYPVAFGVQEGGWQDAVKRYRPWALQQKWVQKGTLSQRRDVPQSLYNIGVWIQDGWVWNGAEGSPSEMNKPLISAAKELDVPLGLHWYNWHQTSFDNLYPHFLPAKEGFKERVNDLKSNGIIVMPYINGTSVDMNIPDFYKFEPHAIKDEAGGLLLHFYSDNSGRLLSMCPNQVFWQDQVASLTDDLSRKFGITGIYIDQISAMQHELCFDKSHLHPLGGGSYWTNGNRDLLQKVKNNNAWRTNGEMIITSEGSDEVFLDLLDGNLLWAQPSEREIPMMEMIYSGYTIFYGSPCDYTKSDNFFRYAQGQAFIDGRQNGWMGLGLFKPGYSKKVDYLKMCGKLRLATKKYLVFGQLMGPLKPSNSIGSFTEDGFGWMEKTRTATVTGAEARIWKAEDGNLAVFLVNYLDTNTEFAYSFDPTSFGFTSAEYEIHQITSKGTKLLNKAKGAIARTDMLDPGEIKIVEIRATK